MYDGATAVPVKVVIGAAVVIGVGVAYAVSTTEENGAAVNVVGAAAMGIYDGVDDIAAYASAADE